MRALAALVLVLGLALTGPAAHAERWAAQDQRGDVTSTTYVDLGETPVDAECPDPPSERDRGDAQRDLRRLAVDHGREAVTVTLTMRAVRARSVETYWTVYLRTDRKDYQVGIQRADPGSALRASLTETPDLPEPEEIEGCSYGYFSYVLPCADLLATADARTDRISLSVPRGCLKGPRWVSAAAVSQTTAGPNAAGVLTVARDFWGPRGSEYEGFDPPFGPRVSR